jgi:hypothetical protein
MRKWHALAGLAVAVAAGAFVTGSSAIRAQQQPIVGPDYLYIEEFEITRGMVPNDAIAEASDWVRGMRNTGEFRSVKLYIHNTGPRFALYILAEPNSWQALETGFEKFFAARPDIMSSPLPWGLHSDNLLSEIPVE